MLTAKEAGESVLRLLREDPGGWVFSDDSACYRQHFRLWVTGLTIYQQRIGSWRMRRAIRREIRPFLYSDSGFAGVQRAIQEHELRRMMEER